MQWAKGSVLNMGRQEPARPWEGRQQHGVRGAEAASPTRPICAHTVWHREALAKACCYGGESTVCP